MKKVIYNGRTESYPRCSSPDVLVRGKMYNVIKEEEYAFYTDYFLEGVEGNFNSCWFDEVDKNRKISIALGTEEPVIGRVYHCYKIELEKGEMDAVIYHTFAIVTSPVAGFEKKSDSVYQIETCDSIYYVLVCH